MSIAYLKDTNKAFFLVQMVLELESILAQEQFHTEFYIFKDLLESSFIQWRDRSANVCLQLGNRRKKIIGYVIIAILPEKEVLRGEN